MVKFAPITWFGLAAALATPALAQPPAARIDQLGPAPSAENRAATPADQASVTPRPSPRGLAQTAQIPATARATVSTTDMLTSGEKPQQQPSCVTDARLNDVLAHLPPGVGSAVDACATLYWLEDERRADEAETSDAISAVLADQVEQAEQQRQAEARRQAELRREPPAGSVLTPQRN